MNLDVTERELELLRETKEKENEVYKKRKELLKVVKDWKIKIKVMTEQIMEISEKLAMEVCMTQGQLHWLMWFECALQIGYGLICVV